MSPFLAKRGSDEEVRLWSHATSQKALKPAVLTTCKIISTTDSSSSLFSIDWKGADVIRWNFHANVSALISCPSTRVTTEVRSLRRLTFETWELMTESLWRSGTEMPAGFNLLMMNQFWLQCLIMLCESCPARDIPRHYIHATTTATEHIYIYNRENTSSRPKQTINQLCQC